MDDRTAYLLLALVLLLGGFLSMHFFYGPSWINGSDDYIYVSEAHQFASTGTVPFGGLEDNVKFLLFFGIGTFVALLGYSQFSLSLFGIFCFLGTILSIYIIGCKLYNKNAGVIAAFLYSIFPIVVINSSNVGDDVPVTFFITLSIMFAILGLGNKKHKFYPLIAGFISVIGFLIVPEGALGFIFLFLIYLSYLIVDSKPRWKTTIFQFGTFLLGSFIALTAILLIGTVYSSGNAFSIFSIVNQNLLPWKTNFGIQSYINWLLPRAFQNNIYTAIVKPGFTYPGIIQSVVGIPFTMNQSAFGYFGFVFIASLVYLLITKEKRALIPVLWFFVLIAYLGFGSQSLLAYVPVLTQLRFAIVLCPPITLVIALAFANSFEFLKSGSHQRNLTIYLVFFAVLLLFAATSIPAIEYFQYSQYNGVMPLLQIGNYIDSLGPNATVFGPTDLPWLTYTNYKGNFVSLGYIRFESNCNVTEIFKIQPGDYMVGVANGNYSGCGFTKVFSPHQVSWLRNYTGFVNWGMNFSNSSVYKLT